MSVLGKSTQVTTITHHLHQMGPHSKHSVEVEEIWDRARDEAALPSVITNFSKPTVLKLSRFKTHRLGDCFLKSFPFEE